MSATDSHHSSSNSSSFSAEGVDLSKDTDFPQSDVPHVYEYPSQLQAQGQVQAQAQAQAQPQPQPQQTRSQTNRQPQPSQPLSQVELESAQLMHIYQQTEARNHAQPHAQLHAQQPPNVDPRMLNNPFQPQPQYQTQPQPQYQPQPQIQPQIPSSTYNYPTNPQGVQNPEYPLDPDNLTNFEDIQNMTNFNIDDFINERAYANVPDGDGLVPAQGFDNIGMGQNPYPNEYTNGSGSGSGSGSGRSSQDPSPRRHGRPAGIHPDSSSHTNRSGGSSHSRDRLEDPNGPRYQSPLRHAVPVDNGNGWGYAAPPPQNGYMNGNGNGYMNGGMNMNMNGNGNGNGSQGWNGDGSEVRVQSPLKQRQRHPAGNSSRPSTTDKGKGRMR
ncbi:hypothetical protein BO71DRAFT_402114 [Aspergillus ellipticus CBS 707.79]|uniref:Uncharacterized protein n=1 Tax=Aspergillus ellipticus CBS 707.79 TaxID=1448320 RepID=A0A319CYW3_9EURO|nr:hypothetical protein BO71DRAFT_402114 [Aspergillus ellipticus CBS 707.79]